MSNKEVDFLVIGAQKSGTTSLYQYLKSHPSIFMPKEKEVCFFSDNENYNRGLDWYLNEFFPENKSGKWGEASPQYMTCMYASKRIAKAFKDIKLVAILRNPIDRCHSAYRMQCRRGNEVRDFDQVLSDGLSQPLQIEDNCIIDKKEYFSMSLYGEILEFYIKKNLKDQIYVCFLEDLEANPVSELKKLYSFLGVDASFSPQNLGKKFHQGGKTKYKLVHYILWVMRQVKPLLPRRIQRALRGIGYWMEQWNIKSVHEEVKKLTDSQRKSLVNFFKNDVKRIEREFGLKVPWVEFNTEGSEPSKEA